ncbi:hypothetical protein NXS08_06530 [Gleimia sp. 6138-11-ORH1]|uniref:hypothetical protein n=1 Tax=Gleimia sp. 6138-11-ORH1 TaxID=2973937 RepID=UPI002168092F|nr:hypothetical protein [Gleimia sp. 6138-11-ORH1]MCS4485121.1 hypothetical protein [Gleimia sp. 6138-11-ORH1]
MKTKNYLTVASAATLLFSLAGCSLVTADLEAFAPNTSSNSDSNLPEPASGPLADPQRVLAERKITSKDSTISVEIDFGNSTSDQKYSAPLRGLLVAPKPEVVSAQKFTGDASPLVVISHLRVPNCADGNFSYPCAQGSEELRYDQGMHYYAQFLAENGYTVIIPDLGGIFVGSDVQQPYDQRAMWKQSVGKFVDALKSDSAGETNIFGVEKLAKINFSNVGLLVHSRSAAMVEAAQELFGKTEVKSVLAYGPAYDTVEIAAISPAPADIPYLAVAGEYDADVGPSANLWLGHYLPTVREHPANVVSVPGLGHMLINETAASAGIDDRIGCDERECPDATEHQRVLKEIGLDWFNATLTDAKTSLPITSKVTLPEKVANLPARWLAHTPKSLASVNADQFKAQAENSFSLCINPDPMSPIQIPNACPEPKTGIVQILTEVGYLTSAYAEVEVKGASGLAVHVTPVGSMADEGAPIEIVLTLADGTTHTLAVAPTHPALQNRSGAGSNGIYQLATIRLELPAEVSAGVIKKIEIAAKSHPIEIKSVDFF